MSNPEEKVFKIELTGLELKALSESVGEAIEETSLTGNNITLFIDMASYYVTAHPAKIKEVFDITRNYTNLNQYLSASRFSLNNISNKAAIILKHCNDET
jgi:hypothetical protein